MNSAPNLSNLPDTPIPVYPDEENRHIMQGREWLLSPHPSDPGILNRLSIRGDSLVTLGAFVSVVAFMTGFIKGDTNPDQAEFCYGAGSVAAIMSTLGLLLNKYRPVF
jgi:hypothetical protein